MKKSDKITITSDVDLIITVDDDEKNQATILFVQDGESINPYVALALMSCAVMKLVYDDGTDTFKLVKNFEM